MKKMDSKLKSFSTHLDEQYGKKGTETREKYGNDVHIDEHIITRIDNPEGRIKYKDSRKKGNFSKHSGI